MPVQANVVAAVNDLEGDLRRFGVGSCAIVYPDAPNLSESVRGVFDAIRREGCVNYSLGSCDLMYLEGTDVKIETIKMTNEVMLSTYAGKLVIPKGISLRLSSRR